MKVPFADLRSNYLSIKEEIDKAISEVIGNSSFIKGHYVSEFEKNFASFCGSKQAIGVSNGTAALYLALLTAGIKKGDEVITVPNTFIATTEAISAAGGIPRFVDVNDYYLMDISKLKEAINKKTKAIVPVHLHGHIADMPEIIEIAEENNLKVIEDAAQAHGAGYNGKRSPLSSIACYSFFPAKNLGAFGDAGCVVTNNLEIAEKIRMLVDHGRTSKYEHAIEGFNHRLDALQAAILDVKLKYLDKWVEMRRKNASLYKKNLSQYSKVTLPKEKPHTKHAYHLYVIRTKERDKLKTHLESHGIETGIHYPIPLHLQQAYKHLLYNEGSFPQSEQQAKEILSLPLYPELSEEQINYVCEKIKDFMNLN